MFTEDQKIGYIVEANKRALASNGASDVTAELRKMAQAANMPLDEAERMMGYKPGVLTGGSAQPAQQANLGMGGQNATIPGYNPATQGTVYNSPQPSQQSQVTPLNQGDRANWNARFESQAKAQGKSVGQVMYEYAKQNNLSNADVDAYMGYSPGTADSWVSQNIGSGGAASGGGGGASANLGLGAASGNQSAVYSSPNSGANSGMNPQYPGVNNANPYLAGMGRDIGNQLAETWQRQMLPSIRSGAMAVGGFGGSRQGVVEANALNDLGKNYVSGLTNLYGTDYTNAQNRGLQKRGMDQSYDLGLRNNDLGFSNLDYQINQGNFGNQLAAANFGLGVQNNLMNNNLTGISAGTNIQNTPQDYQKYYNDTVTGYGNTGGTRNGTTTY